MIPTKLPLYGLILAGGYSRRMGQDKALLNFHGKTQIEYVHDLLKRHCQEVFLSKRAEQDVYKGFKFVDDANEFLGIGPLGGILSAMRAYPKRSWLVVACDLPNIENVTLTYLIEKRNPQRIATAYLSKEDQLPEPLCAIWEAHAFDQALLFVKEKKTCPRKFLINHPCLLLEQEKDWLTNVNVPDDLLKANKEFS